MNHPTVKEALRAYFRRLPTGTHVTPARAHAEMGGVARYFVRSNVCRAMDELARAGELEVTAGCEYALARKAVAS